VAALTSEIACRYAPMVELGAPRAVYALEVIRPADTACTMTCLDRALGALTSTATSGVRVSIDLSVADLERVEPTELAELIRHHGRQPEALIVRIADLAAQVIGATERLCDLGVAIAVVDVDLRSAGAGLLAGAPIDLLELPAAVVAAVDASPSAYEAAARTVATAHRHDWTTVARGVARTGQLDALIRAGCDLHVGPLAGPPLTAAQLAAWT